MAPSVIVVGGGLSGLSAAHTIYLAGGNVTVLDKQGEFPASISSLFASCADMPQLPLL
jgi:2-polyprenyl-6-methoxyphenol hydroxylase-like FAD-dependent oxidoreductase